MDTGVALYMAEKMKSQSRISDAKNVGARLVMLRLGQNTAGATTELARDRQ
jgi:hypothetical protein